MKFLAVMTLFFLCLWQPAVSNQLHAEQMQHLQGELAGKMQELDQQQQQIYEVEKNVSTLQGQISHLQIRLAGQRNEMERAESQLRQKMELIITHPDLSTTAERERFRAARQGHEALEQELNQAKSQLALVQADLEGAKNIGRLIERDIQVLQNRIADLNHESFRREVEQERTVRARGEASCGNMSIEACKRLALEQARRNAAETGSAVIIDSFTEVQDFQLTRDEIRSHLSAIVLRHQVIAEGFIGHSGFFYDIEAVVKGQIPPGYRVKQAQPEPFPTAKPTPQPVAPAKPPKPAPPKHQPPPTHTLFIIPEPASARITLLNPTQPYTPGMPLPSGNYLVEVAAEGYVTTQEWIRILDADLTHVISLQPLKIASTPKVDADQKDRDRHFVALSSGIVRDTRTGLEWYMGPDRDTDYRAAARWASRLNVNGGGWRLPSGQEIETIFERGKESRNMSRLFQTRGWFFWTSDSNWFPFDFSGGVQGWHELKPAEQSRGIAVRKR